MSNEVTAFASANLPSVSKLSAALKKSVQSIAPTGFVILKFDKTGTWVFGANSDEVEEGSTWAVNPYSFSHGYIAWGDGSPVGEKMVSMTDDLPEAGPLPPGADEKGWQHQVGLTLKCTSGQDAGMEVRYAATSVGGKRAVQALGLAIAEQIDKAQDKPVAIVRLEKDSYKHSSYGRVFVPVFKIVDYVGLEGPGTSDALRPPGADEEPVAAPRRRRSV